MGTRVMIVSWWRAGAALLVALQFAIALLAGGPAIAMEDGPGSPRAGKRLALEWCAKCHVVAEDQATTTLAIGPPFTEVARTPGVTEFWLRAFLVTPHELMPNFILTPEETDDIVAYILTLKGK